MNWAQIKKSINSNLTKPLDTLIEEVALRIAEDIKSDVRSYAAPKSTALSTSNWTSARATKLDKLDSISAGTIKSIQRGTATGYAQEKSYSISTINPSKSFVIFLGASNEVILMKLNSTSFVIKGGYAGNSVMTFSWQVVEFY